MKDDLKEVVQFAAALANVAGLVLEDGKLGLSDLGTLATKGPDLVVKAVAAVEGINNLKIGDALDPVTRAELVLLVKAELDLPQDVTEERIEAFVDAVAGVLAFIGSLKK